MVRGALPLIEQHVASLHLRQTAEVILDEMEAAAPVADVSSVTYIRNGNRLIAVAWCRTSRR